MAYAQEAGTSAVSEIGRAKMVCVKIKLIYGIANVSNYSWLGVLGRWLI